MSLVSIVYPIFELSEPTRHSLAAFESQSHRELEILLVAPEIVASDPRLKTLTRKDRFRLVRLDRDEPAMLWERGWRQAEGELVFFACRAGIAPEPDTIAGYVKAFSEDPAASVAYGNYWSVDSDGNNVKRLVPVDTWDLSETADGVPLKAFRKRCLQRARGLDLSLQYAASYDLRLRLTEHGRLIHVEHPFYRILPLPWTSTTQDGAEATAPRESEFERVFYSSLRRRNVFLSHSPRPVVCPHAAGTQPMVSVVMLSYNRVGLIGAAIESVLANDFGNFELIIVDNGSTDGTLEKIGSYLNDSRIHLVHSPRNHLASARNLGARSARGKYVMELDSDDEYLPHTLRTAVEFMESHPSYALGVSYYQLTNAAGEPLQNGLIKHLEYNRNNILRTNGAGAVRVWHRCVLEELGGFDESRFGAYAEDYDLILRLSERYELGRIHDVLYRCRRHADNSERRLTPQTCFSQKALARRLAYERRLALNQRDSGE